MTLEIIKALTELVLAMAAFVGPPSAAYVAHIRRQERKEARARGETPAEAPLSGAGPVVLLVLAGAAWAYLLAQQPQLARLLPALEQMEFAKAAPLGRDLCAKDSECGTGCSCNKGRCVCSSAKPQPFERQHPRKVASLNGTIGDCLPTPWHVSMISAWPSR